MSRPEDEGYIDLTTDIARYGERTKGQPEVEVKVGVEVDFEELLAGWQRGRSPWPSSD